jgi:putative phosphoribosyl transferase
VILGLPRGGVPVAYEVANALSAPLDVYLVRKLGVPGREELAFGAIAGAGTRVIDEELIARLALPAELLEAVEVKERRELKRRHELYRTGRPALELSARNVVLVDDGLATGASMLVALASLRERQVRGVTVAVPVALAGIRETLRRLADDVVCLLAPRRLLSVGHWYGTSRRPATRRCARSSPMPMRGMLGVDSCEEEARMLRARRPGRP